MLAPKSPDVLMPPVKAAANSTLREQFLPRANAGKIALYFHQIHALLNAGVGLSVALDEMSRSAPNDALRRASGDMRRQLDSGRNWSLGMQSFPALFPPAMVTLIASGEKSGNLVGICGQLSEFAEQEHQMRVMLTQETWYPKVLLFFSTIVFPMPIMVVLWGRPFMLGIKEQLILVGVPWLLWLGASWVWPMTSRGKPRLIMDDWKLRMPIIKEVAQGFAVAKTCRLITMLYGAGVSLPAALRLAARGCGNAAFGEGLWGVAPRLERGESLSAVLTSTGQFPYIALTAVQAAEQSGDFEKNLSQSVRLLEADAKTRLLKAVKTLALIFFLIIAFKIGLQVIYFWTGAPLRIGG